MITALSITGTNADLALIDNARKQLTKAASIDIVKNVADKCEAVRLYLRRAGGSLTAQNTAAEIRLWAIRRAGELLAGMEKHNGDPRLHDATRLADLGIEKTQSHRWQRIAALPLNDFEGYINSTKGSQKELTFGAAFKLSQKYEQASTKDDVTEATSHGLVTDLQTLLDAGAKFPTIYADPPWRYGNTATRSNVNGEYKDTMTVEQICAEPVKDLTTEKAHLHLWTTNAFLFEAQKVIAAWGFEYKSCFVWVKPQLGIGNYWRVSHEFLLLGVKGGLRFNDRGSKSWAEIDRGTHSRKPKEVRRLVEKVSGPPYLELYGREPMDAPWTVYGNEVERHVF